MGKCKKCDDELRIRTLRIVNGKCWNTNCNQLIKVALVEYYDKHDVVRGPRKFTDKEMRFAAKHGAKIESKFSIEAGFSYLGNECPHCVKLIGDAYLERDYSIPSKNGKYNSETLPSEYCFVCDRDPTIGEEFLIDFFKELGLPAKYQFKLLENPTTKEFFIADFYIENYDIYVEFLGEWDKDERRKEYLIKKRKYSENHIKCIYIWPENLGFIHYYFDKEIQKVMKEHNMTSTLRGYRFFKFRKSTGKYFIYSSFFVLLFMLLYSSVEIEILISVSILIGLNYTWIITNNALDIFKKNKFPLYRLLE